MKTIKKIIEYREREREREKEKEKSPMSHVTVVYVSLSMLFRCGECSM